MLGSAKRETGTVRTRVSTIFMPAAYPFKDSQPACRPRKAIHDLAGMSIVAHTSEIARGDTPASAKPPKWGIAANLLLRVA